MRRISSLVIVAALVGLGVWGYFYAQSRGASPKYRTARVERGPLTAAVSSTGNLNAVILVQVGSQVSGQVKELFADFNTIGDTTILLTAKKAGSTQLIVWDDAERSEIEMPTPEIDCTSVVSAVSRDSTSPVRVTSKNVGSMRMTFAYTALRMSATTRSPNHDTR